MLDINNSILHSLLVMNGRRFPNYNKVYFYSNENISSVLSNFDVNGKKVLSVLGSGDQAFHLMNRGAERVDIFDINKLAIYYYYFRMWVIDYYNRFYPNDNFSIDYIKDVLSHVKIRTEEEKNVFNYWLSFIENVSNVKSNKMFYRGFNDKYNNIDDLSLIKEKMRNFSYYNVDVANNVNCIDKKYDVIYLSNIPDYITPNYVSFEKFKDNMIKLLNKNGYVISTKLRHGYYETIENEVFSEDFYIELLRETIRNGACVPLGKVYKKK